MLPDKPLTLLIDSNPPPEIIPELVEWGLTLRKRDRDYRYAKVFQIESADVNNPDSSILWMHVTVFIDTKIAPQNFITSASTKEGIINYFAEDAKGDLLVDPVTRNPIEKTLHSDNIRIYCCLPVQIAKIYEELDWHSETPLERIL